MSLKLEVISFVSAVTILTQNAYRVLHTLIPPIYIYHLPLLGIDRHLVLPIILADIDTV
jgi:hypothetical protein